MGVHAYSAPLGAEVHMATDTREGCQNLPSSGGNKSWEAGLGGHEDKESWERSGRTSLVIHCKLPQGTTVERMTHCRVGK